MRCWEKAFKEEENPQTKQQMFSEWIFEASLYTKCVHTFFLQGEGVIEPVYILLILKQREEAGGMS